jgi:hypothetical protein
MPKRKKRPTPKVGSRFEKTYQGKVRTLLVVESEGQICFKMDGKTFASPTAAAKSLTKSEINGWNFWGMD